MIPPTQLVTSVALLTMAILFLIIILVMIDEAAAGNQKEDMIFGKNFFLMRGKKGKENFMVRW